jgi:hypothetical protein
MYEAGIGAILSLFGGIAKHPSEGTLPNRAKGSDVILADSDVHLVPYFYVGGVVLLLVIAIAVILKKK